MGQIVVNGEAFLFLDNPASDQIKTTAVDFLKSLPGPTVIDLSGADPLRTRVVTSLVHGNEPSGLGAIHHILGSGFKPATNVRFILPSVRAAQAEPMLTHRFLSDEMDLNRCFHRSDDLPVVRRAQRVRDLINEVSPEAVIDMHNTSGSGPGFGVMVGDSEAEQGLVAFFAHRAILTGLNVGSLMEQDYGCPVVTIECGGAEDEEAHLFAREGLERFLSADRLADGCKHELVEVLSDPVRVELAQAYSLGYGIGRLVGVDYSLFVTIEHLNTGTTPAGTAIGWANTGTLDGLRIRNEDRTESALELFEVRDGQIVTTCPMHIFMATTRADIAKQDCLFYAVMDR